MSRVATFYFDLVGDLAASDVLGMEFPNAQAARWHARLLAHRTAAENPQLVRAGNYISVRNARGFELYQVPISLQGRGGDHA
jgi:hypothetical protein